MKLELIDYSGNMVASRDLDTDVTADDEIASGRLIVEYENRFFAYDDTSGDTVFYNEATVTPYRTVVRQSSTEEAIYGRTIG